MPHIFHTDYSVTMAGPENTDLRHFSSVWEGLDALNARDRVDALTGETRNFVGARIFATRVDYVDCSDGVWRQPRVSRPSYEELEVEEKRELDEKEGRRRIERHYDLLETITKVEKIDYRLVPWRG